MDSINLRNFGNVLSARHWIETKRTNLTKQRRACKCCVLGGGHRQWRFCRKNKFGAVLKLESKMKKRAHFVDFGKCCATIRLSLSETSTQARKSLRKYLSMTTNRVHFSPAIRKNRGYSMLTQQPLRLYEYKVSQVNLEVWRLWARRAGPTPKFSRFQLKRFAKTIYLNVSKRIQHRNIQSCSRD